MIMKGSTPLRLPVMGIAGIAFAASMTLPAWAQQTAVPVAVPVQATVTAQGGVSVAVPVAVGAQGGRQATATAAPAPARVPGSVSVVAPQAAPPAPARVGTATAAPSQNKIVTGTLKPTTKYVWIAESLPAEGQQLVKQFETDADQIRKETETRIAARRQALIKQLEDLQEQYTKAGKLDEAIALRNYLRGMTGTR